MSSFRILALPFALSGFAWSSPVDARVVCLGCEPTTCGFSISERVQCEGLSPNEPLELTVTCHGAIPRDTYPIIVTESGEALPSKWRPVTGVGDAGYLFHWDGASLPAGESLRLMAPLPLCPSPMPRGFCGDLNVCDPERAQPESCCALYDDAGHEFSWESPYSPIELVETAAPGAPAETSLPFDTYVEELALFEVGEDDATAPSEPFLTDVCDETTNFYPTLKLDDRGGLGDVVRWQLFYVEADRTETMVSETETASCSHDEARSVRFLGLPQATPEQSAYLRVFDGAGNQADGPQYSLDFLNECDSSLIVSIEHQCTSEPDCPTPSNRLALEQVDLCAHSEESPDEAPVTEDSSEENESDTTPPFGGAAGNPDQNTVSQDGGCGCSVQPRRQQSFLWFLLASLMWTVHRRRATSTRELHT